MILPADDEKRGGDDLLERAAGEIGPASAGYDRGHLRGPFRPGDERRCGPGARAEVPDGKMARLRMAAHLLRHVAQAVGQEADVETELSREAIMFLLGRGEQVEQERRESSLVELVRDELVARAVSRRPAPVNEHHDPPGTRRQREVSGEIHQSHRDRERPNRVAERVNVREIGGGNHAPTMRAAAPESTRKRRGSPEAERACAGNAGARVLGGSGLTRDRTGGFRLRKLRTLRVPRAPCSPYTEWFGDSRETPRRMRSSVH